MAQNNFIVTILFFVIIAILLIYYVVLYVEPAFYSFTFLLFLIWIFLQLFIATIFFIIKFVISIIKFKLTGLKSIDRKDLKMKELMFNGIVKLNLSREAFRKQLRKSFYIASVLVIFIILQKLIGIF